MEEYNEQEYERYERATTTSLVLSLAVVIMGAYILVYFIG